MCAQSQYNIVLNLQILRVGKVFDMEEFLHLRNALLGKVHILILLIDNKIARFLRILTHDNIHLREFFFRAAL